MLIAHIPCVFPVPPIATPAADVSLHNWMAASGDGLLRLPLGDSACAIHSEIEISKWIKKSVMNSILLAGQRSRHIHTNNCYD